MNHETIQVTADDGMTLSVERWSPEEEPPSAIVHIIHGMAEHAMRYERLATAFSSAGWQVWADDHRGHGKTATSPADYGHFADDDGWEVILADKRRVLNTIREANPDLPVIVVGHSLGSVIARDVAIRWGRELSALVLSGAPANLGLLGKAADFLAKREVAKGVAVPSERMNALTVGGYNKQFRPNRTESDWLSRDQAEVDRYIADPACGFTCSAGFFRDMLTGLDRVTSKQNIAHIPASLPVLVAAGGQDPVTKNGVGTREIATGFAAAGVADVTTVIFEGARHEIFNETNRTDVTHLVVEWIASRL